MQEMTITSNVKQNIKQSSKECFIRRSRFRNDGVYDPIAHKAKKVKIPIDDIPSIIVPAAEAEQYHKEHDNMANTSDNTMINTFFRVLSLVDKYKSPEALIPLSKNLFGRQNPYKEAIENMTAYYYVTNYIRENIKTIGGNVNYNTMLCDPNVVVLCPGDGKQPRSAYLYAIGTEWTVYSIDPEMEQHWLTQKYLPNLKCYRNKLEDIDLVNICKDKFVIISSVHAHINLRTLWNDLSNVTKGLFALSIPCCQPNTQSLSENIPTVINTYEYEIPNNSICDEVKMKNCHILMWHDGRHAYPDHSIISNDIV
jgi:hypothetical protein